MAKKLTIQVSDEFYDGLHAYTSWTALLARFVRDPEITLFNTIVRPTRESSKFKVESAK